MNKQIAIAVLSFLIGGLMAPLSCGSAAIIIDELRKTLAHPSCKMFYGVEVRTDRADKLPFLIYDYQLCEKPEDALLLAQRAKYQMENLMPGGSGKLTSDLSTLARIQQHRRSGGVDEATPR